MEERFRYALEHHQAGRIQEACSAYLELIQAEPNNSAVLSNLGVLFLQISQPHSAEFTRGIGFLKQSLEINEKQPFAHNNLANAYVANGLFDDAEKHYLAAIEYLPSYLEAYLNRAILLKQSLGDAVAKDWLSQFVVLFGDELSFWMCLGRLLIDCKDFTKALENFDRAVALNSNSAEAWFNRGNALRLLRIDEAALQSYRRCLDLNPGMHEALTNMGVINQGRKLFDNALACYDAVLKIKPASINAQYNRALALESMGRFDEAASGYQETLKLTPAYPYLLGRLHHVRMQVCDWVDYRECVLMLRTAIAGGLPTVLPFSFLAVEDDLKLQRICAETFVNDKFQARREASTIGHVTSKGRIRIGYFSSDFRTHPVGFLTAGLFESHNRKEFEVFAISLSLPPAGDPYAARIKAAVEHFVDLSVVSELEAIEQLKSLDLDIAVDLAGHTMDARTELFANRVAPIQVNYLGYPGTMGAPYFDFLLADEVVVPKEAEKGYAEQIIRLPKTFQINDTQRQIGEIKGRSCYGLPETGLVLASFNTSYKINPRIFDIWCRVMMGVAGSVLWLFGENEAQITNLRREAAERGVDPDRLFFAGRLPYAEHLARYAHVDLVLDTLPFNGGTSTSDALWSGAPVLTCMGQTFASRMSASLLNAVGLPELVTSSLEEYESLAHMLISDQIRLADLRLRLSENRLGSELFDTARQTRNIENAYRQMIKI